MKHCFSFFLSTVIPLSLGWLRGLLYLVGSLTWGALACVWVGRCLGWVFAGGGIVRVGGVFGDTVVGWLKQENLAKAKRNSYAGQLEEFRINHDEEGFTVTLEKATGEYDKMHKVFNNFNRRH